MAKFNRFSPKDAVSDTNNRTEIARLEATKKEIEYDIKENRYRFVKMRKMFIELDAISDRLARIARTINTYHQFNRLQQQD